MHSHHLFIQNLEGYNSDQTDQKEMQMVIATLVVSNYCCS